MLRASTTVVVETVTSSLAAATRSTPATVLTALSGRGGDVADQAQVLDLGGERQPGGNGDVGGGGGEQPSEAGVDGVGEHQGAGDGRHPEHVGQGAPPALRGPNYAISIKEDQAQSSAAQISAFLNVVTYALLGFAGIAVVVGIFLILNTFSMLVAARTRELGLLRALGASRRQVTGMVLVEGLLLGLVGATLGLGAGIGLATLLKALISRFGVDLSGTSLVIGPLTPAAAYTVGIGVTVLAAYLPARRAARVSPMAALREAAAPPVPSLWRRSLAGAVLLAGALAALVAAGTVHADLVTTAVLLGRRCRRLAGRRRGARPGHRPGRGAGRRRRLPARLRRRGPAEPSATPCATPAAPAPPPPP